MADSNKLIEFIATGKLEDAKNLLNETFCTQFADGSKSNESMYGYIKTFNERRQPENSWNTCYRYCKR